MNTDTHITESAPARWYMRDYRTKCRKAVKESMHNALCNLDVLKTQTIVPAAGLTQNDMIAVLQDTINEWKQGEENWVQTAKQTIKHR